MNQQQKYRK